MITFTGQNKIMLEYEIVKTRKKVISKEQTYQGEFHWIASDLIKFFRQDTNKKTYTELDANPDHWAFFIARDLKPGQIQVNTEQGLKTFSGNVAVWFPKFSLIEWKISPGEINWIGYLSRSDVPEYLPKKATAFEFQNLIQPTSKEEIFLAIKNSSNVEVIEREIETTVLSENVKKYLQMHFKEDILISELANKFSVSHEYVSKIMKKCYGLSPVYLRSRLRVFSALVSLLQGTEVTKVATDCGFNDVNRFTKQFTKMMKAPPVHFLKNINQKSFH